MHVQECEDAASHGNSQEDQTVFVDFCAVLFGVHHEGHDVAESDVEKRPNESIREGSQGSHEQVSIGTLEFFEQLAENCVQLFFGVGLNNFVFLLFGCFQGNFCGFRELLLGFFLDVVVGLCCYLRFDKVEVRSLVVVQIFMGALLEDLAFVEDNDVVGISDC